MSSLTLYDAPNAPQPPTDPVPVDTAAPLTTRVEHLESEVTELRQHVTQLAEIVVGEIKERRAAQTYTDIVLPSAVTAAIPGAEKTLKAVNTLRRPWLLVDLLNDLGLTFRMYIDPRYRVRRSTQLVVPLILASYVAGYFMFAQFAIPFVSPILERLIDIVLAVLLYKVIASELLRYRDVLALYTASRVAAHSPVPVSLLHNDPDEAAVARQEGS
jgi:hypothetical protein